MIDAIQANPAIVTPRGWCANDSGEVLPLEAVVRRALDGMSAGGVQIFAQRGFGKTVALHHLAARLADLTDVLFLDEPEADYVKTVSRDKRVVFTSGAGFRSRTRVPTVLLARWGDDDAIEYLLMRHRARCASVMSRLKLDPQRAQLDGSPRLWAIVLDAMAADDSILTCAAAIFRHIDPLLKTDDALDTVGRVALERHSGKKIRQIGATQLLVDLLESPFVEMLLAAEHVTANLARAIECDNFRYEMSPALLDDVAARVANRPAALVRLREIVTHWDITRHAMAASVLIRAVPGWRPSRKSPHLWSASLIGAKWAKVDLRGARLISADFTNADLTSADLRKTHAAEALFIDAKMRGAMFSKAEVNGADFSAADASDARFGLAELRSARFVGATLDRAQLSQSHLEKADFSGASCREAGFTRANLLHAIVANADFSGADFSHACLDHLKLNGTRSLAGAVFREATLRGCDLSEVVLSEPDFSRAVLHRADLTASRFRNAKLRGAMLTKAGLAEVDWPDADLRDTDFTDSSFHLGTTRSGLVGSTIASEGSRTGFYDDAYDERNFRKPEEVRKANLCGANLLGADVEGVDWYLVDLRGAKYSSDQEGHFRRCGAILSE